MRQHLHILLVFSGLILASTTNAQLSLTTVGQPVNVDLDAVIPGVVNGPFNADESSIGNASPGPGQLNANAWHIFKDGSTNEAIDLPGQFPSDLMGGEGVLTFPPLMETGGGISATSIDGVTAFGFQPSGNNFTAGAMTLRVQNNTGQILSGLHVSCDLYVLNDRDRSNTFTMYYSGLNTNGSYTMVEGTQVVSPGPADDDAVPVNNPINGNITNVGILPGQFGHIRWVLNDLEGSGQRDEFVLTNIQVTPIADAAPFITSNQNSLRLHRLIGSNPIAQTFTVAGSGLSEDVNVAVPEPFEMSLNGVAYSQSLTLSQLNGSLSPTVIFIRLNGEIASYNDADVTISSSGAETVFVDVMGIVDEKFFVNEFMAINQTIIADEFGEFDDWIELFNPNDYTINLAGYHLSDDLDNLTKYKVPESSTVATINPGGFILFWADNDDEQGDLHATFALSSSGEDLVIVGIDGLTIIDSYTYESAVVDVSEGREFDGAEDWVFFTAPTPNASNNPDVAFISATPGALSAFTQTLGSSSSPLSFTANGLNLPGDVNVSVNSPFQISLTSSGGFESSLELSTNNGVLASTTIFVRLNAASEGNHSGQVMLSSGEVTTTVNLQGETVLNQGPLPIIYLNEFMANNTSTIADEFGEFDDWIEIYNPNNFDVNLSGYYISDDLTNLTKYQIPAGTAEAIVPAQGHLIVWADSQSEQGPLHTNFSLSSSGEDLVLVGPNGENIRDQYTYTSVSADISEGRAFDGAPNWVLFETPTPGSANGIVNVGEQLMAALRIYPNPATSWIRIEADVPLQSVALFSADGRLALSQMMNNAPTAVLPISDLAPGIYILQAEHLNGQVTSRVVIH